MNKLLNSWGRKFVSACFVTGIALAATTPVNAISMTFDLANHPSGGIRLPYYGLRLDGLDGTNSHEFTFDFERAEITNKMQLTLNSDTGVVRLHGQVYGGQDIWGSRTAVPANLDDFYADNAYRGLWDVDFTYNGNITFEFDQDFLGSIEVTVNPEDHVNHIGTIERVGNPALKYVLQDEDGNGTKGFSFKFNNTDDHRLSGSGLSGPDTFVGWGWVNHHLAPGPDGEFPHVYASDWLFSGRRQQPPGQTGFPGVPEPVTGMLSLMGLSALGMATRRRTVS